jgi:GNAT superfamily N-acetyltransferase
MRQGGSSSGAITDYPDGFLLRRATAADANIIAEHRARLFADTGRLPSLSSGDTVALLDKAQAVLAAMLAGGEYIGWFLVAPDSVIAAGAGAQIRRLLPRPETLTEREALVVNVYVLPEYRRQGLARRLMEAIVDWCDEQGIERIVLHPSTMGRPLYESLGFVATNELVRYQRNTPSRSPEE